MKYKKGNTNTLPTLMFNYSYEEQKEIPIQQTMYVLDTEQGTIRYTAAEAIDKLRFDSSALD